MRVFFFSVCAQKRIQRGANGYLDRKFDLNAQHCGLARNGRGSVHFRRSNTGVAVPGTADGWIMAHG